MRSITRAVLMIIGGWPGLGTVDEVDGLLEFLLIGTAIVGVLGLLFLIVMGLLVRKVVQRGKQAVAPRLERARTEFAAARLGSGPQRQAVELRRRLATAVDATNRTVGAEQSRPLVSALVLDQHRELQRLATELDGYLKTLQHEPDAAAVARALPEATDWTDQLCGVAAELREAVRDSARLTKQDDVRALGRSAFDATAGLRAGIDFLQAQVHQPLDHRGPGQEQLRRDTA